MGLSPEQKPQITSTTARDICTDIWLGVADFAAEAKFSAHPLVTTAIWSGLYLSVESSLKKHNLSEEVQKCFVPVISKIYNIGLDEVELLADLKAAMQKYCKVIAEGLGELDSDVQIAVFLELVDHIHEDCEGIAPTASAQYTRLFSKYTFLLSAHIDSIIYGTDSGMLLQFGGKNSSAQPAVPNVPNSASRRTPPQATVPTRNNSNSTEKPGIFILLTIAVFVVLIILAISSSADTPSTPAEPAPTYANWFDEYTAQQNQLKPAARPTTGTLLRGVGRGESQITVTSSTYEDCVVMLKDTNGTVRLAFYVRAGETAKVNAPKDYLYVYFASGDVWYGYGEGKMFGEDTVYSMDDERLDFVQYTWEYTLKPITNGNFSETPIDEDDFF